MSGHPYTDEQVRQFWRVAGGWPPSNGVDELLRTLHEAGIKVDFPDPPRFYAEGGTLSDHWHVRDRQDSGRKSVAFFAQPGAETYAKAHARWLNEQETWATHKKSVVAARLAKMMGPE